MAWQPCYLGLGWSFSKMAMVASRAAGVGALTMAYGVRTQRAIAQKCWVWWPYHTSHQGWCSYSSRRAISWGPISMRASAGDAVCFHHMHGAERQPALKCRHEKLGLGGI